MFGVVFFGFVFGGQCMVVVISGGKMIYLEEDKFGEYECGYDVISSEVVYGCC